MRSARVNVSTLASTKPPPAPRSSAPDGSAATRANGNWRGGTAGLVEGTVREGMRLSWRQAAGAKAAWLTISHSEASTRWAQPRRCKRQVWPRVWSALHCRLPVAEQLVLRREGGGRWLGDVHED